jgi:hypothetical protein
MKLVPQFARADYFLLIDKSGDVPRIVGGYFSDDEAYDNIPEGHDARYLVACLPCSAYSRMVPDPRESTSTSDAAK